MERGAAAPEEVETAEVAWVLAIQERVGEQVAGVVRLVSRMGLQEGMKAEEVQAVMVKVAATGVEADEAGYLAAALSAAVTLRRREGRTEATL